MACRFYCYEVLLADEFLDPVVAIAAAAGIADTYGRKISV
ncbi:hypothetical protein MTY_0159 [Moorella thermoacetica Y72]|uniref:Uncharacterized protein n=1 Tax=Moorella thermoacetica Y72 TaxID=1325331 RepID=A0A0S6U8P3_NEOTH|nr:hypothetical protein MTY_0159 [Moorella thermoacetica Y72]